MVMFPARRIARRGTVLILLVISVVTVLSAFSHETVKQRVVPPSMDWIANYTSSFYEGIAGGLAGGSSTGGSVAAAGDVEALMTPAFPEDSSRTSGQVLKENKNYVSSLLSQRIDEPKGLKLTRPGDAEYQLTNATFVSLVRNSELHGIVKTIKQIEETFNDKFHYPYVFLNDRPFNEKFIQKVRSATKSECFFELVPAEVWGKPSSIDPAREEEGIKHLEEKGVGYANKESYHNMCRFYSGGFYNHPKLQEYRYYWRLEPSTDYFCDIDYDVFKFMEDNDKVYGFVLNLYDSPDSVQSLWPTTLEFLKENPQYLHKNSATTWLRENLQKPDNYQTAKGYSTCHFWSNFEVGDMDFYRGEAYSKWMEHLERSGGFYYERWGDAPVHSVGLALFADKSKIHWFRDIGYQHFPYMNCPSSDKCHGKCASGKFSQFDNLNSENCMATWAKYEMTPKELQYY